MDTGGEDLAVLTDLEDLTAHMGRDMAKDIINTDSEPNGYD